MTEKSFKEKMTFEERRRESNQIKLKYPDKIPVIVEKVKNTALPDLDKHKYLVPADINVGQFLFVIRKRIKLAPEQAMFIFIDNNIPPTNSLLSELYKTYKDEDGFLYMNVCGESTFGSVQSVGRS